MYNKEELKVCPIFPLILQKTKSLSSYLGRETRDSTYVPIHVTMNSLWSIKQYLCSVSGAPGKAYFHFSRQTQKCTSDSYPYLLSLSRLAILASEAYSFRPRLKLKIMYHGWGWLSRNFLFLCLVTSSYGWGIWLMYRVLYRCFGTDTKRHWFRG